MTNDNRRPVWEYTRCGCAKVARFEQAYGAWLECEACGRFWWEPDAEPADAGGDPGDAEGWAGGEHRGRLPAGEGERLDDTPSQLALF